MTQEKIKPYEGIDIVHMLRYIAKSWKKMLAAMVILAVLLGGLSYYKNAKGLKAAAQEENKTSEAVDTEQEEKEARSAKEILEQSGLNEKAADEVLYYTNKYYYNQKQYERQLNYLQDSILMQMDPNNVWTITLYYDLAVPVSENEAAGRAADSAIAAAYIAKISNSEVYDRIAEELGVEVDSGYFAELITGSCLDSLSDVDDVTVISSKEDMKIEIRYMNQTGCEKIAQIIREEIETARTQAGQEAGAHTITLLGEREEQKSDPELLNDQKNAISTLGALSDNVINARTNIEASEEAVFEELLEYYRMQDEKRTLAADSTRTGTESEGTDEDTATDEETQATAIKPRVSKKYVALGLFLGIFIVAAWEACRYFFTDTLKQKKELEEGYGLAAYDERDRAVISLVIQSKCEKNGWKCLYEASSLAGGTQTELMLNSEQTECIRGTDNPVQNAAELTKMLSADAVILSEQIGSSAHKEIAKLLDLCRELDKPVICAVVKENE